MPPLQDEKVAYWTNYYASRPGSVQTMASRSGKYIYHITKELEKRNMPTELALLPFVESAYIATALSRSRAAGLWQFIPSTGTQYKLTQDWWKDDRRDPVESTRAALDYLSYLYTFQGNDWHLALASYNWGEGAVKRARGRAGGGGYLDLRMPSETRNYVPKLMAIRNIVANPAKYGITLPSIPDKPYFEKVRRTKDIDVAVMARLANISVDEFKELNPSFNRPTLLAMHEPNILLPVSAVKTYKKNLANYKGPLASYKGYQPAPGESLTAIAQAHGISLSKLKSLNGYSARQKVALSSRALMIPVQPDFNTDSIVPRGLPPTAPDGSLRESDSMLADVAPPAVSPAAPAPVVEQPRAYASNTPTSTLRQTAGSPAGAARQVASNTRAPSGSTRQVVDWDTGGSQPAPRSAPAASDDPLAALVAQNEIRDSARTAAHAAPASYQPAVRPATATVRPPVLAQPQAAPAVRAAAYNRRAGAGTRPPEHFVTQGETLYSLAKRYGTTVDDLKALNNIGTEGLKAGLRLRLPGTAIRG
ncbi:hypothetical protein CAP48_07290 [Advenella sp. S44]|nr:hypothetical protein CAP48_07290 [Advenella sp. S44]